MCQETIHANKTPGLIARAKACESERTLSKTKSANVRRLKIWEVRHNCHCSVVGTCLSHGDLERLLKKCRLRTTSDVTPYGLHGYFVEEMSSDCPLSRAVQKLLDKRHAGMVRTVGRTKDPSELEALWQREYEAGRITGVYWALQTHAHVPEDLHIKIFGEVHMLSHVLGRTVHATAARASELQTRVEDLEEKLARQGRRHSQTLRQRDARIKELENECATIVRKRSEKPLVIASRRSLPRVTTKQDRALISARERARFAEARIEELQHQIDKLQAEMKSVLGSGMIAANEQNCPGADACRLELPEGETLRILYLGGRPGSVAKLRSIAESASVELIHHDGGKEQAFNRINGLISQCHVVFCPIDCISHKACNYAKDRCRRLDKSFVPLASAGGGTFARALDKLEIA